jgi:molybdopterin synthase catalytic subunit
MKVLSLVGPGARSLAARVAPELDGSVATVESHDGAALGPEPDVDAAYGLGDDGGWVGSGSDRTLDELLDDLAADYDYALVAGLSRPRLPTVAFGDATPAGEVVLEADDGADVSVEAVLDAIERVDPHVTLDALVEQVKASPRAERAGAIATFTGRVRAKDSPDDEPTTHLEFEKYEGVAAERMREISRELEERDGVLDVVMHHRTGRIEYGEDIVFVVVLAGHREEAFRTVEDGINRLKDEVPIFKKETTAEEEFWVHDRS